MSTFHRRVIRVALALVLAVPVLLLGTARAGADVPAYGDSRARRCARSRTS